MWQVTKRIQGGAFNNFSTFLFALPKDSWPSPKVGIKKNGIKRLQRLLITGGHKMKRSEIEVDGIYSNGKGSKREVLGFPANHPSAQSADSV